jgi:hypothetical protein
MTIEPRVLIIGLLLITTFVTGLWLYRSGAPYATAKLTIHKLIGLVTALLVAASVNNLHAGANMSVLAMGAVILTAALYILAGLSGGLLAAGRPQAAAVKLVHRAAPVLALLSTAALLYVLVSGA